MTPRRLKLMPDYQCNPLWEYEEPPGDLYTNPDPAELPLSQATIRDLRAWAAARAPEPAAAPKRVDVVDAIPLTAVGKVFKPELRRRAAEAAARDALAGIATDAVARLAEGQVVVTVRGGDRAAVRDALAPFAFDWVTSEQETGR